MQQCTMKNKTERCTNKIQAVSSVFNNKADVLSYVFQAGDREIQMS